MGGQLTRETFDWLATFAGEGRRSVLLGLGRPVHGCGHRHAGDPAGVPRQAPQTVLARCRFTEVLENAATRSITHFSAFQY